MINLTQIQQRIKAIKTIKKTTHAMRLIAMSNHTILKNQQLTFQKYCDIVNYFFIKIRESSPDWKHDVLLPEKINDPRSLIVMIGSQKSLCGNFNAITQKFFQQQVPQSNRHLHWYAAFGKTAVDYLRKNVPSEKILLDHNDHSINKINSAATVLTNLLMNTRQQFSSVVIFYTKSKTFFVHKAEKFSLIPFRPELNTSPTTYSEKEFNDYQWEHNKTETLTLLAQQCLQTQIEIILFESLIAEQSARFIAMDSSTRNAEKALEATIILYNKARQAKITKELAELNGNF